MAVSRDATYVSRSVQWGELRGMRKIETVEQMTPEYRETALKIVYALASTEFASVEQHQPWVNAGPTAEDRFVQAQVAADEAHQGMEDYRLLVSFGPDGEAMAQDLLHRKCGDHLLGSLQHANGKLGRSVYVLLHDGSGRLVSPKGVRELQPGALRARDVLHGARRALPRFVRRQSGAATRGRPGLSGRGGGTRADVETALRKWYPRALDTFGGQQVEVQRPCGPLRHPPLGQRGAAQMYLQDINPMLLSIGLQPPAPEWDRHVVDARGRTPLASARLAVQSSPRAVTHHRGFPLRASARRRAARFVPINLPSP